jgi:outer membrane biosynthesis protein TonB
MSARKPAVAKVATKVAANPAGRAKQAPAKAAAPAASADGAATQDTSDTATRLARDIDRALNEGRTDLLSEEALQALMAAVCRSYSARIEAGGSFPPLANRSRVTSTDVMVTASGLLKAANLAVFELGMWQSWTGR